MPPLGLGRAPKTRASITRIIKISNRQYQERNGRRTRGESSHVIRLAAYGAIGGGSYDLTPEKNEELTGRLKKENLQLRTSTKTKTYPETQDPPDRRWYLPSLQPNLSPHTVER